MKTMPTNLLKLFLLIFIVWGCDNQPKQNLVLQPLFSNNMVLQQGQEIPVWGIAKAKSHVSVSFRNQFTETVAATDGKWMIRLKAETVGTGDSLLVKSSDENILYKNVAVGEVWLASGQSNMEVALINSWAPVNNDKTEVAAANYPNIRFLYIGRNTNSLPVDTIESAGWTPCTSETAGDFSAIAYFFARDIYSKLQVPVGIIQSAWGGTTAQAWTSKESLALLEDFAGELNVIEALPHSIDEQKKQFEEANLIMLQEMAMADKGINGNDSIFISPEYDDSKWEEMHLPGIWEETALGSFDGSVWFRKQFVVPEEYDGIEMNLNLASVDDFDEAWVNGIKVGSSKKWESLHQYVIPKSIIKKGINIITLRITDGEGGGGYNGKDSDFSLTSTTGFELNISGNWKLHVGYDLSEIETKPVSPYDPNRVSTLFNGMINPLIPYAIKGVIWYQGESNTYNAEQYSRLLPNLISNWRNKWDIGDFPFYIVQLPNHLKRNTNPTTDNWAELREAQTVALEQPNTGIAITIDLGDAKNIHPGNKQDVGKRLALLALNKTYQYDIPFSGPIFKKAEIINNKIILDFDYRYDGLQTSDKKDPIGFAIAGDDQIFYWANAKIRNHQVVLSSNEVKKPKVIRYAWSANPECNLINSEDLPTRPFRTDHFLFNSK